jgi:hypothetical protein
MNCHVGVDDVPTAASNFLMLSVGAVVTLNLCVAEAGTPSDCATGGDMD